MSEATAVQSTGLMERREAGLAAPIPLVGVKVEAEIRDCVARVRLSQRYRNAESRPIEAVYVFPLDEGAAVCGFEALIGSTRVVGEVQEREQAFETYDEALLQGHGAYLLDQERPDVFTASVGNLPPGAEVTVVITTVAELSLQGQDVRFVLPTTVSPRYAPAQDQKGVGRTPAEALNPPRALDVPYGLDLSVNVEMGAPLTAVESPSHAIRVELDGERARVKLGERLTALDRDFVLLLRTGEQAAPRVFLERDPRGGLAALLAFRPRFESGQAASELWFLIDRSGSMDGSSIEEARNALQLCLRSLTAGQRFNVVGFGSTHQLLFPESRPYDEQSFREASTQVAKWQADLGGTEILPALEDILARPPLPGLPRQLFVLTDGQVSNTEEVIALVRKHSGDTRVFSFGIGAGASYHLVKGVARAGEGSAEFIAPGERVEAKVLRQLQRALAPAFSELALEWGGRRVTQAPFRVPPVFDGGRVIVYGLLEAPAGPFEAVLKASEGERHLEWRVRVDPAEARDGSLLGTLAARALIRDLEEGMSPLHDRRGSLQERGQADRVKREIVRLGTTYGLASRHTSFVAVERRETPVTEEATLRRVPIALTRGWGGIDQLVSPTLAGSGLRFGLAAPPRAAAALRSLLSRPVGCCDEAAGPRAVLDAMYESAAPAFETGQEHLVRPAPSRPLDRLVALQRFDGAWDLTPELARELGRSLAELEAALGKQRNDPQARRALATSLALRWLEAQAAAERDEWALLARKAADWLRRCPVSPDGGGDWPACAERLLA